MKDMGVKCLNLGDQFPNFEAETTHGKIDFYEWMNESWAILFSHPSDFTPVCTTELARVATLMPEFDKRNVKPIALSCDTVESHKGWIEDIKSYGKLSRFDYPIIADNERKLAIKLNMLDKDELNAAGIPVTCRAVFIIDEDKKLRLQILYPATTGRNFDEILRVIDSLQLTTKESLATPADWKQGDACMVLPTLSEDQALEKFPKGFTTIDVPSKKKYIRQTQP
uniref:1-Cys peroxiredoxin n=1 Tax=Glossina brevipalpis TaxID=37001 RepID=A0A1A9WUM4_9MUSC